MAEMTPQIDEEDFAEILLLLWKSRGVDFSFYKRPTMSRRIGRRMQMLRIDTLANYVRCLKEQPGEVETLFCDLLISVTEFFRDPETFDNLKCDLFPELIARKGPGEVLRVWAAGVSTGEEAYSLGITLLEALEARDEGSHFCAQIFASDVNEHNLEKARAGVYSAEQVSSVSPARLSRFFESVDGGYRVCDELRRLCMFTCHNVVSDPLPAQLDLISCRNLMIYFGPVLQERVAMIFHYALSPGGFLLLGRSEGLPRSATGFRLVDRRHHLYVKTGGAELPLAAAPLGD